LPFPGKENTLIEANTGTFLRQGNLYLGKIKVLLLRDFYQASHGREGFSLKKEEANKKG